MRKAKPIEERFWPRVEKTDECWLWHGYRMPSGHGQIGVGSRGDGLILTHVLSFKLSGRILPPGKFVLHKCNVPYCVRPEHLYAGTKADNLNDAYAAGRRKWNAEKKHCPQGHPYDEENTYVSKTNRRHCRKCAAARSARYRNGS